MKAALFQQHVDQKLVIHGRLSSTPCIAEITVWRVSDWEDDRFITDSHSVRQQSRYGVIMLIDRDVQGNIISERFWAVKQSRHISTITHQPLTPFEWVAYYQLAHHLGQESPRKLSFAKKGK